MKSYNPFKIISHQLLFPTGLSLALFSCSEKQPEQQNLNTLFISVDDLRTELNCYGEKHMHTPNIERLAAQGILFERAYCQQAVCAPSRNSLMTVLRPDAMGIYDLQTFFREKVPDVITVSQHFINKGYHAESMGKIYHVAHGNSDDSLSWSVPKWDMGEKLVSSRKSQC